MAIGIYKLVEKETGEWVATLLNESARMSSELSQRFESEDKAIKFIDTACPGHKRVSVKEFNNSHKSLFGGVR